MPPAVTSAVPLLTYIASVSILATMSTGTPVDLAYVQKVSGGQKANLGDEFVHISDQRPE